MKRIIAAICIFAMVFAFGACGGGKQGGEAATPENADPAGTLTLRIVDGAGTDRLVLAGEKSGEVYTLGVGQLTLLADGEAAALTELQNGMLLSFDPGYMLLETWPMQITGATARLKSAEDEEDHGDLCGVYLQVLEDLWTDDGGLNGDITYISVDLHTAPGGLTDGEKAAVTWIFAGRHNAQGLQYSFEELKENGYIKADLLYWEDGLLFGISQPENGNSTAKKLKFDTKKWRSGLGAIFYNDCTAKRGKGVSPPPPGRRTFRRGWPTTCLLHRA